MLLIKIFYFNLISSCWWMSRSNLS